MCVCVCVDVDDYDVIRSYVMLQVCIWSDTHSTIGRLACYAGGTYWFYAYGIQLNINLFHFHSFCANFK
jgi:hypothetical protein